MLLNQIVADFAIPATSGVIFKLSSTRGKRLVIYFYPKDDTPGCTTESQQFRDLYADFKKKHKNNISDLCYCIVNSIDSSNLAY